jgi:hypothetical protein
VSLVLVTGETVERSARSVEDEDEQRTAHLKEQRHREGRDRPAWQPSAAFQLARPDLYARVEVVDCSLHIEELGGDVRAPGVD